jgi:hypothetical protein
MLNHERLKELDFWYIKNQCSKIHYFGLGFIQLKFPDHSRLHFYVDDGKLESIHTHRYDFRSIVIRGEIIQELFQVTLDEKGENRVGLVDCRTPNTKPQLSRCSVECDFHVEIPAGGEYSIRRSRFHRVMGKAGTVIPNRVNISEYAQVINPSGCPFANPGDPESLWKSVNDICKYPLGES